MEDSSHVLAQVNIGRLVAPLDSPQLADFVAWLDPVNAVADAAPGFVWRLQTEDGDATALRAFEDDAEGADGGILINMSVWESVEALAAFVFGDAHREVLRRRRDHRAGQPVQRAEVIAAAPHVPRVPHPRPGKPGKRVKRGNDSIIGHIRSVTGRPGAGNGAARPNASRAAGASPQRAGRRC